MRIWDRPCIADLLNFRVISGYAAISAKVEIRVENTTLTVVSVHGLRWSHWSHSVLVWVTSLVVVQVIVAFKGGQLGASRLNKRIVVSISGQLDRIDAIPVCEGIKVKAVLLGRASDEVVENFAARHIQMALVCGSVNLTFAQIWKTARSGRPLKLMYVLYVLIVYLFAVNWL